MSLRYRLEGAGDVTVVLVHEMAGCIESWDRIAPVIAGHCRVLRYDQRGFGLSEKVARLSFDDMVNDLVGLLDALDLREPVFLAGCTLGAALCLGTAHRHADRVSGLLLSSPATGGMTAAARARMEDWLQQVVDSGMRAITDRMFAVTYPEKLPVDPMDREQHRLRWLSADPESFIALNRMLFDLDLDPILGSVTTPALLVGCRADAVRSPEAVRGIAAKMPRAAYREVDSGHYFPLQSPHLFASVLLDWLANTRVNGELAGLRNSALKE